MKRMLSTGAAMATALASTPLWAQDAAKSLDTRINEAIAPISNVIAGAVFYSVPVGDTQFPLIVGWLLLAATIFTFYFGFIQFRGFGHSIALVKGDYEDPNYAEPGETTHFQALTMALSGTVGLGNIAGVAVAVSIGGPGATFWMILAGLVGMASKFTECILGVKYRLNNADGTVSGGPMYYLSRGLAEQGRPGLGKVLAVFFAICCIGGSIGGGNMFQANQAFQQVVGVTGGATGFMGGLGWLFGLVMAALVGWVIIGGAKSIASTTDKLVPFMALLYVGTSLLVLAIEYDKIGWAFGQIIDGAFTGAGVVGGVLGALIQGFKRAAFSNEAGIGSAAIAHSTVKTNEPVTEGYVALLEPFVDTVVICTMTALVIVISGTLDPAKTGGVALTGVDLTSAAFSTALSWFPYVLVVAVVLFAFSTMISWFYYGFKAWTYLFGTSSGIIFKIFFLACVVIGSSMTLGPVIDFSDSMIFVMSLPNIVGLYFLMPVVKRELHKYQAKVRSGELKKIKH